MSPDLVTVAALVLPAAAIACLVAQPPRVWRGGAEHSRWFWVSWALGALAVGLVGRAWLGGGGGVGWLGFWSAASGLQPSMIADVLEVRRLRRRRRHRGPRPVVALEPVVAGEPALRPIHWRAPATAETAGRAPRARVG